MFGLGMSTYGNLTNASMAYLPFMQYNPFGITNFGGDLQIFPVENYGQSQIGLAFNQIAQMSGWSPMFGGNQIAPFNPHAIISGASSLAAQSLNQLGSQEINTALQTIASQKAKIQAQLQAKDLKPEDKAKLEEQLKKLEEYEAQIKAIATSGMDPQSAYLKANELKVAVNNLIAGKADTTTNQGTENPSGSSSSGDSSGSVDSSGDKPSKTEPKTFIPWVRAMRSAIYRPGTDNEVFEAGCDEITKDDVIERMIQWNMINPKESFMEAFMADADSNQKKKYGQQILDALADKALELGIDLSKDQNYIKCQEEMDSWLYIDNGVADNFNELIKKIAKKMGYKYTYSPYSIWPK